MYIINPPAAPSEVLLRPPHPQLLYCHPLSCRSGEALPLRTALCLLQGLNDVFVGCGFRLKQGIAGRVLPPSTVATPPLSRSNQTA